MNQDQVLKGVVPANQQQQKKATPSRIIKPVMTSKHEATARHQRAGDAEQKSKTFGLLSIESQTIERQILAGNGAYHPLNVGKKSIDETIASVTVPG